MPAYSIAEVDVLDQDGLQKYSEIANRSIAAHGGSLLFVGVPERAEGEWPDGRTIAVFEFPTMADLRAWYSSPEYVQARSGAAAAMRRNLLFLEFETTA